MTSKNYKFSLLYSLKSILFFFSSLTQNPNSSISCSASVLLQPQLSLFFTVWLKDDPLPLSSNLKWYIQTSLHDRSSINALSSSSKWNITMLRTLDCCNLDNELCKHVNWEKKETAVVVSDEDNIYLHRPVTRSQSRKRQQLIPLGCGCDLMLLILAALQRLKTCLVYFLVKLRLIFLVSFIQSHIYVMKFQFAVAYIKAAIFINKVRICFGEN